ncbi:MAG: cupin domain-containing protein [Candidatus Aegiribacteria sp.]|nr:cupin domain-containing protein [Candidatus Aegiribacteria sp.]
MMIKVCRPDREELEQMGVFSWPIWTCESSTFDWTYDMKETCYILEGDVTVEYEGGKISFGAGDLVVFPKGLSCVWKVSRAVRKHYNFE